MSNYNRISAINSDGYKSTLNYGNPSPQNTTTETFRSNGGNIISTPEFNKSRPPSMNHFSNIFSSFILGLFLFIEYVKIKSNNL